MRLFRAKKEKLVLPSLAEQFPDFAQTTLETIRCVMPFTMTSPERIAAFCDAVRYVVDRCVPGAIVECGVWRGGSVLAAIRTLLELDRDDRDFWLYDTFDGMTEPTHVDVDFLGRTAAQLLAKADRRDARSVWCQSRLEQVQRLLVDSSYPPDRLNFVQGRVESTIPYQVPDQIAILRLDTDWYESTKHELNHLLPRLRPGGILIVDDYGHWEGCRRAVDEYFREHQVPMFLHRIDYTGRIGVLQQALHFETIGPDRRLEAPHATR
jgi:hypothetical protein